MVVLDANWCMFDGGSMRWCRRLKMVAVMWVDDRSVCKRLFQCIRSIFVPLSKVKWYILLQQVGERVCYLAEVLDKPPVKSCMSKKRSNLFHRRGVRQL